MSRRVASIGRSTPRVCAIATLAITCAGWLLAPPNADAQPPAILSPGDAVVTGFSGVTPPVPPFPSGSPLHETFIDLNGISMRIQRLQPNGSPQGQVIPAPDVYAVTAGTVGQVFATTLDDQPAPNIFLGASSVYGLQIVTPDNDRDGRPERITAGQPNAQWMPGQWGPGGSPGSIWRIDGTTGTVSLFTSIGANVGPGLGDIVFDRATRQFFVSDLDAGLIYRLANNGLIIDTFDHGADGRPNMGLPAVTDDGSFMSIASPAFDAGNPATWGYTQPERMVWGMAIYGGRLYYAVSEGPQIWSVGINLDGSFGNDPRWEFDVAAPASTNPVSDILFDSLGRIVLAQRGAQRASYDYSVFAAPSVSSVLRFRREFPDDPTTPGTWVPVPEDYAIGFRPDERNTNGGIALGYGYDQSGHVRNGACNEYLWTTGESLRDNPALTAQLINGGPLFVHGLQGNHRDLVRPANDPPFDSYFTDYDSLYADPANQGHIGDVEIWQPCASGGTGIHVPPTFPPSDTPPPQDDTFNLRLDKRVEFEQCIAGGKGWLCYYAVRVTNTGPTPYWGEIVVADWLPTNPSNADVSFEFQPPWSCGSLGVGYYQCTYPPAVLFPGESVDLYVTADIPDAVAGPEDCYLPNAAQFDWLPGEGDADPTDDFAWASAKVPSAACPPREGDTTNLSIAKGAFPPECKQIGSNWVCQFAVGITNTGPGVYDGPLKFTDALSTGAISVVVPAPWTCAPDGPAFTCERPPVVLNPGDVETVIFQTEAPAAELEATNTCEVINEVQITDAPGGTERNTDPADDVAVANALIPADHCRPAIPTDLSIEKEVTGCSLGQVLGQPPGFLCSFKVVVRNSGTADFIGRLMVRDTLSVSLQPQVSYWDCVPDGNGYLCDGRHVALIRPGEGIVLRADVFVPDTGEICRVENTATLVNPAGGTNQNTDPGNDSATAGVDIPSGKCIAPVSLDDAVCPIERRKPDGDCCPEGQNWNGRSCGDAAAAPPPPAPPPAPPAPACPAGSVGTPPDCRCPPGTAGTPPNCAVPTPPARPAPTPTPPTSTPPAQPAPQPPPQPAPQPVPPAPQPEPQPAPKGCPPGKIGIPPLCIDLQPAPTPAPVPPAEIPEAPPPGPPPEIPQGAPQGPPPSEISPTPQFVPPPQPAPAPTPVDPLPGIIQELAPLKELFQ